MQKLGAVTIITSMIVPWMVMLSLKTFSTEKDIGIIYERLRILDEVRTDVKLLLKRSN